MTKSKGPAAFDTYYQSIFGGRWPGIKEALLAPKTVVALQNPHCPQSSIILRGLGAVETDSGIWHKSGLWPSPPSFSVSPLPFYLLDMASIQAARALAPRPGELVLDLCAAPGGKCLSMAFLQGEEISITANERSATRRARLKNVVADYLPSRLQKQINVTSHDAARWGMHQKNAFDKILLDAPCSSERHMLQKASELDKWAEGRTRRLAAEQFTMLCSAADALKVGGTLLYSTCSISPLENDAQIKKLLQKRPVIALRAPDLSGQRPESTSHGHAYYPDQCGFGPLYLSLLQKNG